MAIDIRYEFINEQSFKLLGSKLTNSTKFHVIGQTICHHDDEGFYLTLGNEVVHNQTGTTLTEPTGLILTPAMLQVKYGEAFLSSLGTTTNHFSIRWRRIYPCSLHLTCTLRWEQNLLYIAMLDFRTILVEILIRSRYLNTTLPTARAEVIVCTRVIECTTVNSQVIIVEAWIHWTLSGSNPNTILIFTQHRTATSAKTKADNNRLCFWSYNTKAGITLAVYLWELLTGLIQRIGMEILFWFDIIEASIKVLDGIICLLGLVVLVERQRMVIHTQP